MEFKPQLREDIDQDIDAINQSWEHVILALKQATLESVELDNETRANLDSDFWSTHSSILAQCEKANPGIAKVIMDRAEAISASLHTEEVEEFETKTLPQAKRRAYMRGFMSIFSLDGIRGK